MHIRKIRASDNSEIAAIIRKVMTEHHASGPGFAIHDAEVDHMFESYCDDRSAYFVVTDGERILGGGGVAHLKGAEPTVCELRKMYFLDEIRGKGLGKELLELCLSEAKRIGYALCYLETLDSMKVARHLYEKLGFQKRCSALGATGHFGCNNWYEKKL